MTREEAIAAGLIKPSEPGAPTPEPERPDAAVFRLSAEERARNERAARQGLRRERPT